MAALLLALLAAAPPKLAVMPISPGEGVPPTTAAAVTEALAAEVRRRSGAEVITQREIESVLSLEAQKAMLGCDTQACMAELGGALGVERLVAGTLARLGESWLVHLKVVETGKVKVAGQSDRRIRGGTIDDVLDALPPMVAELFPGGGGAAPPPAVPAPAGAAAPLPAAAAAAGPAPVPWKEEPVEHLPGGRGARVVFTDGRGHFVAAVPGLDDALFSGDERKLFRVRVVGGGREGDRAWSVTFWDPRFPAGWQRTFDFRDGQASLQCGERKIAYRIVPPFQALRELRKAKAFEPRWRRIPRALARDDEGNYFLLEGARGADGRPLPRADWRLWVGPKARMALVELVDVAEDAGGLLAVTPSGRLAVGPAGGDTVARWIGAAGERKLTWLAPEDHGPLLYGELSVWAGQALGTPCDPHVH